MFKDIGGYIELELNKGEHYIKNATRINSGRNGLKYTIKAYKIKEIFVPRYTCPVVWQAIEEENCHIKFYDIDESLLPKNHLPEDSYILYTNYFGICSKKIRFLSKKYPNLIVDNAQAFYMPHIGISSIYSPRKFFGVPDGGYVICNKKLKNKFEKDFSYSRFSHLIKRIEGGANFGYNDFNKNDESLVGENIKEMSTLTSKILEGIDYKNARRKRLENYKYIEKHLKDQNLLQIELTNDDVPMYYPFLFESNTLRKKLIDNHIYIPKYWRNMEEKCKKNSYELYLKEYIFPIIIDQRYDIKDMTSIVKIITNEF